MRFPALFLAVLLPVAAWAQDADPDETPDPVAQAAALATRYPELAAADLADPARIRELEDHVNGWFDTDSGVQRAAHLKALEKSSVSYAVIEAVVRRGRRYEAQPDILVGNLTLPPNYKPDRPVPVMVGFNMLTNGWEREAMLRGFACLYPWNVRAWVDPLTTDGITDRLWDLSKKVNIDFDRIYASGYSVGGHGTWVAAVSRADRWAGMLPISGSPGRVLVAMGEAYMHNLQHLPVRSTAGVEDEDIARMLKKGIEVSKRFDVPCEFDIIEGRGHESFDDRAEALLGWVAELKRARYPAKLDYYGGEDMGHRHYWIEALKDTVRPKTLMIEAPREKYTRTIPAFAFHVLAEIKENTVSIHTKEVAELRVCLSDAMVDFDQEVTIRVNGKFVWKGKPERSIATLLESSMRRKDRFRTFCWEREFDANN